MPKSQLLPASQRSVDTASATYSASRERPCVTKTPENTFSLNDGVSLQKAS